MPRMTDSMLGGPPGSIGQHSSKLASLSVQSYHLDSPPFIGTAVGAGGPLANGAAVAAGAAAASSAEASRAGAEGGSAYFGLAGGDATPPSSSHEAGKPGMVRRSSLFESESLTEEEGGAAGPSSSTTAGLSATRRRGDDDDDDEGELGLEKGGLVAAPGVAAQHAGRVGSRALTRAGSGEEARASSPRSTSRTSKTSHPAADADSPAVPTTPGTPRRQSPRAREEGAAQRRRREHSAASLRNVAGPLDGDVPALSLDAGVVSDKAVHRGGGGGGGAVDEPSTSSPGRAAAGGSAAGRGRGTAHVGVQADAHDGTTSSSTRNASSRSRSVQTANARQATPGTAEATAKGHVARGGVAKSARRLGHIGAGHQEGHDEEGEAEAEAGDEADDRDGYDDDDDADAQSEASALARTLADADADVATRARAQARSQSLIRSALRMNRRPYYTQLTDEALPASSSATTTEAMTEAESGSGSSSGRRGGALEEGGDGATATAAATAAPDHGHGHTRRSGGGSGDHHHHHRHQHHHHGRATANANDEEADDAAAATATAERQATESDEVDGDDTAFVLRPQAGPINKVPRQPQSKEQYVFPKHRLPMRMRDETKTPLVIVACGSFSPPTYLHLRIFEMAKDAVIEGGKYELLAGYYSPVSDYYRKEGLAKATHRVRMCELAVERTSTWLMVDAWESLQDEYQRTAVVLDHFDDEINGGDEGGMLLRDGTRRRVRIMLLAGGDLIQSMGEPGVWADSDMHHILGRYGCLIVERTGADVWSFLLSHDLLWRYRRNLKVVKQVVYNDISSSKVRLFVRRGQSIKYLLPNSVIHYIERHKLYRLPPDQSDEVGQASDAEEAKRW